MEVTFSEGGRYKFACYRLAYEESKSPDRIAKIKADLASKGKDGYSIAITYDASPTPPTWDTFANSLMASRRKKPRCSSSNTVPTQRHRIMRLNFSKGGKRNRKFKRGIAPMLSKEGFCKALQMIKEQESIDEQFSKALNLVGDGHFVFGAENKYLMALRDVLKEAVNDQYDYIDWWLYEATDDYTVWEADCTMKYCLKDPEALYDYITGTLKPVPVSSGESTSQQE